MEPRRCLDYQRRDIRMCGPENWLSESGGGMEPGNLKRGREQLPNRVQLSARQELVVELSTFARSQVVLTVRIN
jgi:hypothetical protein